MNLYEDIYLHSSDPLRNGLLMKVSPLLATLKPLFTLLTHSFQY